MYKYHCTNCSYIYNPYFWDEEQEINPWTDFEEISEDWSCPVCSEWKENFIEVKENILEATNLSDLLPQEERHIPFYKETDSKLIVTIGTEDEPFVQDDKHFIEYVWVYDDYGELIEIIDFPSTDDVIEFELSNDEDYEVRASCSLHWVWRWIKLWN